MPIDLERVVDNDDGSKTFALKYPVKREKDELLAEVTIQRPRVGTMRKADDTKGPVAKSVVILEDLTALPKRVIEKLDVYDFEQIDQIILEMMGKSPGTGGDS